MYPWWEYKNNVKNGECCGDMDSDDGYTRV